jgi:hypothetical protein
MSLVTCRPSAISEKKRQSRVPATVTVSRLEKIQV